MLSYHTPFAAPMSPGLARILVETTHGYKAAAMSFSLPRRCPNHGAGGLHEVFGIGGPKIEARGPGAYLPSYHPVAPAERTGHVPRG